ncbi:SulP family inorganic anion transporter [Pontibacter sp. 172403-2]|uniref:SulP family inorganic anion transporter n=1 Tax=Pontibacter rufus TaxID=2791028 RepID=UPI0018B00020|nr:SulP family inorganic anion transporter [Pontibacter sp. 172403-2]MBF9253535.1 SulP family inorganic anion transporter [Pontibacter sp. 172403-2]
MLYSSINFKEINYKNEVLSGLTVALALVPEAVAFAFVAGVDPLVGLYAAFMVCLITSIFGGRPGMISGATGALAVVMVSLVKDHGVEYLFATVVLMGVLQMLFGLLKLGKFIRFIPEPVIYGFVNGLAIVIFMAQFGQFKVPKLNDTGVSWIAGVPLYTMLGLVVLTMAIIFLLPKLTKAVPAALTAIVVVSAIVIGFNLDTRTVGDMASVGGGFPAFHIPAVPFNLETLKIIFPYAFILAGIGLLESLLTLTLVDEITQTRGRSNQESAAQGLANVVAGFFGSMGGCAMIGQSMINVTSGGRTRLSGITAGVMLLVFILFASSLIEMVPLAALVGLMFMVAIGTFEWSSFRILRKIPKSDAFVLVAVSVLTVIFDLAIAVAIGVVISAMVFAWNSAVRIRARKYVDDKGVKHYEIYGPLFFASTANFLDKFDVANDPDEVIVDFAESRVADHSGIEAVNKLTERYLNAGKTLHLRHLSEDCRRLLKKAGNMVEVNIMEDPHYAVVTDRLA